jgi:LmbE family N-acetylglucosaminyl deacetylase
MNKTVLAIGAHYDDCPFGIPGILLQAVRRHYRVVILNIIGDYSGWAPVKGRAQELVETSISAARERGMEMRFLKYASMQFEANAETKQAVADVVTEVKPDVAFMLWHQDRHPDHEVAAAVCKAALRGVRRIYAYDNGPGHTIGFEPNAFVDITAECQSAMEWLGGLMAFVQKRPYDPKSPEGALTVKETLARYRGMTCGVKYAEAVWASRAYPVEIF